jgi:hypothetical protein
MRASFDVLASTHGLIFFSTSTLPGMKNSDGVPVLTASGSRRHPTATVLFYDQLSIASIPSTSITNDLTPEFKIDQHSASDSMVSSSVDGFEPEIRDQSSQPTAPVPPVSVPPHVLDEIQAAIHASSSDAVDTV